MEVITPQVPGIHAHRVPRWLLDAGTAVLLFAVTLAPIPGEPFRMPDAFTFALVGVAAVVLPLRRVWPIPTLVATVTLYGVAAAAGVLAPGLALAVAIGVFEVVKRSRRGVGLLVGAITGRRPRRSRRPSSRHRPVHWPFAHLFSHDAENPDS